MDVNVASVRLRELVTRAEKLGVPRHRLRSKMQVLGGLPSGQKKTRAACNFLAGVLSVTVALAYCIGLHTHAGFSRAWLKWQRNNLYEDKCTIRMPDTLTRALRPPEDCSFCRSVDSVDERSKLSPAEFEEKYAYSGRPVLVKDGMENWTAHHVFSFDFFKKLYEDAIHQDSCQFFPYETEFNSLREVFNMSRERALMQGGTDPWYIGWSNCDDLAGRTLRMHYDKPYFLPPNAENKNIDWIFMGSPGYGAKMHIDNVNLPSWQAQLRGKKKWTLQPPPECYYECKKIDVVVNPGEIIVLDTNRWYHQTLIVSDDMSITIGAEYD
ncbi:uncharacterized protein LOC142323588 [Lycorma delicatula]|uniref:uncharacterized protein LOC142323588 n=1 Tax=Lycorma delicatula TaxID=130591 RepID=UPI003F50FC1C